MNKITGFADDGGGGGGGGGGVGLLATKFPALHAVIEAFDREPSGITRMPGAPEAMPESDTTPKSKSFQ